MALFDYIYKKSAPLSPKDVPILKMISREDRHPKGKFRSTFADSEKAKELSSAMRHGKWKKLAPAIKGDPFGDVLNEMKEFFKKPDLKHVPENWRELRDAELENGE